MSWHLFVSSLDLLRLLLLLLLLSFLLPALWVNKVVYKNSTTNPQHLYMLSLSQQIVQVELGLECVCERADDFTEPN